MIRATYIFCYQCTNFNDKNTSTFNQYCNSVEMRIRLYMYFIMGQFCKQCVCTVADSEHCPLIML